mmetsp:Transcript_27495/g.55553  ORF Transcript_27495/g.55553 Transcript_27495/m.55553 type:complete len:130 (-) Transcript_27495:46-435(-)
MATGDTSMSVPSRDDLMAKSAKELKEILRTEGYNPDELHGIEKRELVDKILVLLRNPVEADFYPLPLYSNCWPQFILRALLLAGLQIFFLSYLLERHWNWALLALVAAALTGRNLLLRRWKAAKRRKRA